MTTLFDVSGIRARIFTLPNRPPFMIAADLAEVYGTTVKALNQAVSRNLERFPEDFSFLLTEAEEQGMWSQIVTTSARKRDDIRLRAYTHAGALMLSAVLSTTTAAQVSVIVHRAFAAMEAAALDEAKFLLVKLRTEETRRRPIRMQVVAGNMANMSFDRMWKMGTASRPKLAMACLECLALGLIDRLPDGTPQMMPDLFGER